LKYSEISDNINGSNNIEKYNNKKKTVFKNKMKYFIDLGLVITFSTTFLTGFIKFPGILQSLGINLRELPMYEISIIHDYGAMLMGWLILGHLLLNFKWIISMTKKMFKKVNKKKLLTRLGVFFIVFLFLILMLQNPAVQRFLFGPSNAIMIEGIGSFDYDPAAIETIRPDIFQDGHFSIFDVLVYLDNRSKINLEYHFDNSMNTHIIDKINGKSNWWYEAYFDQGWPEDNVYRMDHYPHKNNMYISFFREDKSKIEKIYGIFKEEITRIQLNGGKVIIPRVIIQGTDDRLIFDNVEVTAHNLRDDFLQNGTITAIDVIMSLGDAGKLDYKLQWYDEIGLATVKNYWVEKINDDKAHDRCGFVYEEGSYEFHGFSGNHIHIPSDIRVINSPEYEEWFWICI
jgi:hypothetical protein